MIQLYNVSKVYDNGVKAISDLTLHIKKGEFVFLVGPSGAGKSTLIKLLFREELPTRGQVMFNSKNVARMKAREIPHMRRKIGMIFQDFRLLPQKTAAENVAFALQITGASNKEIRRLVPQVLEQVGLKDKGKLLPSQLSGGEQQRVCIARAIVNNPLVIIADEPTGNLDPDTSWEIMKLLQDINRRGTTILMATHASDIVDAMKKRVVELSRGCLVRDEESGVYRSEL
ncbi:cell division ATP-binding protein FtsE [Desulfotomaculum nigrificans CO-1-SRB]|uniref:Cell division ATP-binding protein FtsE n=1 Tax=Desulfotomaculum nigrificans (strain DSM 14880 / VKM B-2319 / CO-1-SRB) TaxID=868595 RepID=F6B4Z6_DESCC|nr:cell division ATP-binding protein FtsE [Desulfotomaculum nigrificans]AEF95368.1 cell division ATP-binding protein FtsE [Desulfotomaculum nigrificans CO-1-SRB]